MNERRRFAEAELRRAMRREMERKFAEVGELSGDA